MLVSLSNFEMENSFTEKKGKDNILGFATPLVATKKKTGLGT